MHKELVALINKTISEFNSEVNFLSVLSELEGSSVTQLTYYVLQVMMSANWKIWRSIESAKAYSNWNWGNLVNHEKIL